MPKLFGGIWDNSKNGKSLISSPQLEIFDHIEDAGVRWSISSYGVERIEVTVRAHGQYDIKRRLLKHRGKRLALFDGYTYRPISGFITNIRPISDYLIQYSAAGPGWRMFDVYGPTDTSYTDTTTTSALLKTVLTDDVYVTNGNLSNIDETSTVLGGWTHTLNRGDYPGNILKQFIKMGNSSGEIWDFYLQDDPISGGRLGRFKPVFKNRSLNDISWHVKRENLVNLNLNSSINEFRSKATIWYGGYSSTATGGGSNYVLDSGATFSDGSFSEGDEIWNITDGSRANIRLVSGAARLDTNTLTGGTLNSFASGDKYTVKRKTLWNKNSSALSSDEPFYREISEHYPFMTNTQAGQYASALIGQLGEPVQTSAFSIGGPLVAGQSGNVPLWHMIAKGGGVIKIDDHYPDTNVSQNAYSVFFITSMDYGYKENKMRLSIDTLDSRLDARLKAAGIIGSEMIAK